MRTTRKGRYAVPVVTALATALLGVGQLDGQDRRYREPRLFLNLDFMVADPVGEFGEFVEVGYGVSGSVRYQPDPSGPVSLRLGGGFLEYGRERQRACLGAIGCRIEVDVVTSNDIAYLDFGPEIGVPRGDVRPYIGASAGFSYFSTRSSIQEIGYGYDYELFDTEHFDDLVFAWRARGGMLLRLSRGRIPVFLDLAAVYHGNGDAEYLTEGDVVDNPDGSLTLYPIFSEANLVTFELGVSIGLGGGREGEDDWDRGRRPRRW